MIGIEEVRAASAAIAGETVRTPVVRAAALDSLVGAEVFLKAENLQRGGAFKLRGALNAIRSLDERDRARGIVAASSGNHAQAVALAAALCGTTALVLMPEDAPEMKRSATTRHGAEVVSFDRFTTDREVLLRNLARSTGRVVVHPYDDERVMAGQGTAALELLEDVGALDHLVAPIGGGGLISGCATVMSALMPAGATWGVEPEAGDDTQRSLRAGHRVRIEMPVTIADGQQLVTPGELPFAVIQKRVRDVVTVTDEQISTAMRFLFEHAKLVAEPSGACALAALLAQRLDVRGTRVGVIVSGGNVDLSRYADLLTRAAPRR